MLEIVTSAIMETPADPSLGFLDVFSKNFFATSKAQSMVRFGKLQHPL